MGMIASTSQPEPKQAATQTSERKYICDRCGHEMYERTCKIICPNCGNRFDCSDLNIYFD
jgi:rubrerythrin